MCSLVTNSLPGINGIFFATFRGVRHSDASFTVAPTFLPSDREKFYTYVYFHYAMIHNTVGASLPVGLEPAITSYHCQVVSFGSRNLAAS